MQNFCLLIGILYYRSMQHSVWISVWMWSSLALAQPTYDPPPSCLSSEEVQLVQLINQYRHNLSLPSVKVSRQLSTVAQWHVRDLQWNHPDTGTDRRGHACSLHSWSGASANYKQKWSKVCYTLDHNYANNMWDKPQEISQGKYTGAGYEIAVGGPQWQATASSALALWKSSIGHNDVIIEAGAWQNRNWPAMGVGLYGGYAVVWFGDDPDPSPPIGLCAANVNAGKPTIKPNVKPAAAQMLTSVQTATPAQQPSIDLSSYSPIWSTNTKTLSGKAKQDFDQYLRKNCPYINDVANHYRNYSWTDENIWRLSNAYAKCQEIN